MKRQGEFINISVRDNGIGMGPDSLRRLGEPEDVAGAVVFLCSRAGAYV